MLKEIFLSAIFILLRVSCFAQTNRLASENLDFFEEPSIEISKKVLQLQSFVILGTSKDKSSELKREIAAQLEKEKTRFRLKIPFNGQEEIKKEFIRFLDAVALDLTYGFQWIPSSIDEFDSAMVVDQQGIYLERLDKLTTAGVRLDAEIQNYCLLNRINGRKKKGGFYSWFSEAGKAIRYSFAIQTVVLATRATERRLFSALTYDTSTLAMETCRKLTNQATQNTLKIKAIVTYPADNKLKTSALNSLRLYHMEATTDLKKLLTFKEKERDFILLNRKMDQSSFGDEQVKDSFRKALKEYLGWIKKANDLVKSLEKQRLAHEKQFDLAYRSFIESKLGAKGW